MVAKGIRSILDALPRLIAALVLGTLPHKALGFVYPEHRQLSLLAVQQMDAERRAVFDRLWQEARGGDEQRFCAAGADTEQGIAPSCIDWAALSAIAGDHSCSSREMFGTARSAPWILQVADVGAQLKEDLARIPVMPSAGATEKPSDIVAQARAQVSRGGGARSAHQRVARRRHPAATRRS